MHRTFLKNSHLPLPLVLILLFSLLVHSGILCPRNSFAAAPTAVDDAYSTDENVVLSVAAPGVLGNDRDADNDALIAVLADGPSYGTLDLNDDGFFSYTHDGSENIIASFTYVASDSSLASAAATVTIRINPDITLAWDQNQEADLAGYRLYYQSGSPIDDKTDPDLTVIDIPKESLVDGNNPTYTVKGLDATQVYFFAVTAYDDTPDNESEFSNGASTLRITEPAEGFVVNLSDGTHFKIKGKGVPGSLVEVVVSSISLGTVEVDVDGGWTKHVDFTPVAEGMIELTVVSSGVTSFPVEGTYDRSAPGIEIEDPPPAVIDRKDSYAMIEWTTDESGFGAVQYGLDENYGHSETSAVLTANHRVIISGLAAATEYHFRVSAEDDAGNGPDSSSEDNNPSPDYRFTTDPATPPSIVGHPSIGAGFIAITFDKPDLLNAGLETSYSFDPALIFNTTGDQSDDISAVDDFTYMLFMQDIPQYEIHILMVGNIMDSVGQGISEPTITINDNDQDGLADDWEALYGLALGNDDSGQDPDGDGLTNAGEYQNTTDPQASDSDFDQMPDGWEVAFGLDPLTNDAAADADEDGYTNLEEYSYGTQPNDSGSKPLPPTANAGPIQTVDEGVTVTLDGSNSSDPDNDIVDYHWQQTGGEPLVLSNPGAVKPTFTAPQVGPGGESFTFDLTVTDRSGQWDIDSIVVNVSWDNNPPTAHAGEDQTVGEGVAVILEGSGSFDPDDGIDRFQWTQTAGLGVNLDDATAARPTFTSPVIASDGVYLEFQLRVTDNSGLVSTDTCIVNISWFNDPPAADAGPDQIVVEGGTVTLDGSASNDPDNGIDHYIWTQTAGASVTLSDSRGVQPTFVTPPVEPNGARLEFLLVVIDDGGLARTDAVAIDVEDNGINLFPDVVLPTVSVTGENIAIEVEKEEGAERGGHLVSFTTMSADSLPDISGADTIPVKLIYGLVDIIIKVDESGGEIRVTIHLNEPAPAGYSWFKFTLNDGWMDFSDHAQFNAARDQVTLTLVDGGIGDDDEAANGMIVDPSGLGQIPQSVSSGNSGGGGGGGGGGGCFVAIARDADSTNLMTVLGLVCAFGLLCLLARFSSLPSSSSRN